MRFFLVGNSNPLREYLATLYFKYSEEPYELKLKKSWSMGGGGRAVCQAYPLGRGSDYFKITFSVL